MLDRVFRYLLPGYCLGCGREGEMVCDRCVEGVVGHESYSAEPLHKALWIYDNSRIHAKLIKAWKYQFQKTAFLYIAPALIQFAETNKDWLCGIDAIVPIPLHSRREAERGFNQAEVIAKELGRISGIPSCAWLRRTQKTASQASLGRNARAKNMQGVFAFEKNMCVDGVSCLLVDDVYTTGATMHEAAGVLMMAGVRRVKFFTLCKDELQRGERV